MFGSPTPAVGQVQITPKDSSNRSAKDSSMFNKLNKLQEVEVHGRSIIRQIKNSPLPVEILDLTKLRGESGNLVNIINRMPGVKLLSNGGMGDPVNIRLNGMDGKAVVQFINGVPLSFYGHTYNLSILPSNLLSRVEVYKGALPISLGADALGGAVNYISYLPKEKSISASYEIGSYNSHVATLSIYMPYEKKKLFWGLNSAYSYSDNNFSVDIGRRVITKDRGPNGDFITSTNIIHDNTERHRLKHNGVRAPLVELYAGLQDRSWADELKLTLIGSQYYRQMNTLPTNVINSTVANSVDAFADDRSYALTLAHNKKLFKEKLSLQTVLGYSLTNAKFIDTVRAHTDPFGNEVGEYGKGYLISPRGSDLRLNYNYYMLRFNLSYDLHPMHQVQFNHILTKTHRLGHDPRGGIVTQYDNWNYEEGKPHTTDIYKTPATHNKQVSGLGLRSHFFNRNLESIIAVKRYWRRASGYSTFRIGEGNIAQDTSTNFGWLAGLSYRPTERWLLKTSYEHANRLPDDEEVFGDSYSIRSNYSLKPENSRNLNFQLQYNSITKGKGEVMLAISGFYRLSKNEISIYRDFPYSYYTNYNLAQIKTRGFEIDAYVQPLHFFSLGGNFMLMERTKYWYRFGSEKPSATEHFTDKSPVLANLQARLHKDDLFAQGNQAVLYYYWNYLHRFTYYPDVYIPDEAKGYFDRFPADYKMFDRWVPRNGRIGTHNHNIGIQYRLKKWQTSISVECRNLMNQLQYDRMFAEKPGRSFFVKLNWEIVST